jgi:RimJ/RimL family protein N-acetyltransferase
MGRISGRDRRERRVSVTIREATMDDAVELHAYAIALFAEKLPGIFRRDDLTMEQEIEFLSAHVQQDNAVMFVAESDGRIVGNIGFVGGKLAELSHAGEFGVSVARGYRGSGVGTLLIGALQAWAPAHGVTRIEVHAFSTNPGGLRLYERLGYEREGLLRRAAMVDGEPVDILVLSKLLG